MLDPKTGRTRVRMVDIDTEYYKIARRYMLRLRRDDFDDAAELERVCQGRQACARRVQRSASTTWSRAKRRRSVQLPLAFRAVARLLQ